MASALFLAEHTFIVWLVVPLLSGGDIFIVGGCRHVHCVADGASIVGAGGYSAVPPVRRTALVACGTRAVPAGAQDVDHHQPKLRVLARAGLAVRPIPRDELQRRSDGVRVFGRICQAVPGEWHCPEHIHTHPRTPSQPRAPANTPLHTLRHAHLTTHPHPQEHTRSIMHATLQTCKHKQSQNSSHSEI